MSISFFYVTAPNLKAAKQIAQGLLENKLIACANIIPNMQSHYLWQGNIESSKECVLFLKTKSNLSSKMSAWICAHHPYKVPCIAEIRLHSLNKEYQAWLGESLRGQITTSRKPKTKSTVKTPKVKKSLAV